MPSTQLLQSDNSKSQNQDCKKYLYAWNSPCSGYWHI